MNLGSFLGIAAAPFTGGASLAFTAANLASNIYANNRARKEASTNRAFQADMSGTSHQREVADLRAAGLNPILSATGGSGASTPGGAMASVHAPDMVGAANSGQALKRQKALLKYEKDKLGAEALSADYDTDFHAANARRMSVLDEIERQNFEHNKVVMPAVETTARAQAASAIYDARQRGLEYAVRSGRMPIELDRIQMETSPGARWKRRADYYGSTLAGGAGAVASALTLGKIGKIAGAYRASQAARRGRSSPQVPTIRPYRPPRPGRPSPLR